MNLPKKIEPCPIIDALVEIRFLTEIPSDAVFGLFYSKLKNNFDEVKKLPIMELPDQVRTNDPNLKYKPHYKLIGNNFVSQIGPKVLSISSYPEYIGWNKFSKKINSILDLVHDTEVIKEIERVGIRYINFFEMSIFNYLDLKFLLGNKEINYKNTVFRTELEQDEFISTLQIANNIKNNRKTGSIIDIDTFKKKGLNDFFNNKETIIDNGHLKEKELFFKLLNNDFLKTLNPKY